ALRSRRTEAPRIGWRRGDGARRAGHRGDRRLGGHRRGVRAGVRRRGRARSLAEELGGAPVAQADLTVEADAERLFAKARDALGTVDVCAAVAGVYPLEDLPVWELDLARFQQTIAANLTATFLTARAFLRGLATSGHGALVLVGSTAGRFGEAGHADYAAAKAAIQGGL